MADRLTPIALGGPRGAAVHDLACRLDLEPHDDLRQMIVDHPPAHLLLASSEALDPAALRQAIAQGARLVALEPVVSDFDAFNRLLPDKEGQADSFGTGGGDALIHLPTFLRSAGYRQAAEPAGVLGQLRSLRMTNLGRGGISLWAHLLDAWITLLAVSDLPLTIDASLVGPLPKVPTNPRDATGHVHAHARLSDGRSALLHVADTAPAHRRSLTLIGEAGQVRIDDHHYELLDAQGQFVDESAPPTTSKTSKSSRPTPPIPSLNPPPTPSSTPLRSPISRAARQRPDTTATPASHDGHPLLGLMIADLEQILDRPGSPPVLPLRRRLGDALACALASLLSCRTGQPESPRDLLRIQT